MNQKEKARQNLQKAMEIGLHVDVLKSALDELENNEQASGSVVEESEESEA